MEVPIPTDLKVWSPDKFTISPSVAIATTPSSKEPSPLNDVADTIPLELLIETSPISIFP